MSSDRASLRAGVMSLLVVLASVGCSPVQPADGLAALWPLQVLGNQPTLPGTDDAYQEQESNDTFQLADIITDTQDVTFFGTITGGATTVDRDVYRFDSVAAGDRVTIRLSPANGGSFLVGILDQNYNLLQQMSTSGTWLVPWEMSVVLRQASEHVYVVVAGRSSSATSYDYVVQYAVDTGIGVPGYNPQTVVLYFSGADNVRIGGSSPVQVPAFDAARISSRFAGQTETIIAQVLERLQEDYASLGIQVYRQGDAAIPAGSVTNLYFGTYNADLLGLADSIDAYNNDTSESAIVFTDTFALFEPLLPSVEEMSQCLANVASHELGHLLGLRHTADVQDLMDITANAREMLDDQWFRIASMHSSVLPVGFQDAPSLLAWGLGGILGPVPSGKPTVARQRPAGASTEDFHIPHGLLGTCAYEDPPVTH
ncbi:MAG: matrixin family metalloprotease [Phycisphaerae bacterium]|nr:matrixin family metalloprotease [Phycisphaerae bacterium]